MLWNILNVDIMTSLDNQFMDEFVLYHNSKRNLHEEITEGLPKGHGHYGYLEVHKVRNIQSKLRYGILIGR